MESTIQLNMRLTELLEMHPETRPVFVAHGLGPLVGEEAMRSVGPFLTLRGALRDSRVDPAAFLRLLRECEADPPPAVEPERCPAKPTLLALMPCGLKVPFGEALSTFEAALRGRADAPSGFSVQSNLNHEVTYYPSIDQIESVDDLPDVIVSSDFNAFYHRRFQERFLRPGHFVDVSPFDPAPSFAAAGIPDPHREYSVLCVNPLVIIADLKKVGDRPLPRRWVDLLDPTWRGDITLRGNDRFFCHAVLLPLYREHGASALRELARNVFDGRHPAQMVKTAGSGRSAALYVMPDFFGRRILDSSAVCRIWPEDGALASPVTLLTRRDRAEAMKPVTDFLTGEDLARVFAGAGFPSFHPVVGEHVPPSGKLKWLGWETIRGQDLAELNAEIDAIFLPRVRNRMNA